ncbi:MAG TPA: hypothetical protein PLN69_11920 [bacterium]|nr:hypothetical protein [bacterium]
MRRFLFLSIAVAFSLTLLLSAEATAKKEVKYALAVLHYNLQYVAGDTEIENKIIVESLDPVLDFFIEHPEWNSDIEMQGYMVEETQKRYPETFEKLKKLVNSGRLDLNSFHYCDELFLAYPRLDADWSDRLNKRIYKKLGIRQSGSVFAQEGQFGEGMAKFMADFGFKAIILPKNLHRHVHGDVEAMPYYALNGVDMVLGGRAVDYEDENAVVKLQWTYLNDAELLPTAATPYSQYFKYKPETMMKYGQKLQDLADQGYRIGTLAEYLADVKEAGVQPSEPDPMIDGVWQPIDTDNIYRWMGDYLGQHERDMQVLTGNVKVRHKLAAVEVLVNMPELGKSKDELTDKLYEAWRRQSHAEVSDSTGWTPLPLEIEYSRSNAAAAEKIADEIAEYAKKELGAAALVVDVASGSVEKLDAAPADPKYPEVDCPAGYTFEGEIKNKRITCYKISDQAIEMELLFKTGSWLHNHTKLTFERKADYMLFSPSLWETHYVKYPVSGFKTELPAVTIPCSNGLIALDDNLFLIKETDTVHSAYRFGIEEKFVSLEIRKPPAKKYKWIVFLFTGTPEEAVEFANSRNVFPKVVF